MKRIVPLAARAPITVVMLLFGYHTSTSGPMARRRATVVVRPAPGAAASGRAVRRPAAAAAAVASHGSGTATAPAPAPAGNGGTPPAADDRHRRRRADPVGAGPGPAHAEGRHDHRRRRARSTRAATRRTDQINSYALPILIAGDASTRRARTSTWSAARPSPATATSSRCRARSTRPACDRDAPCTRATSSTSWACRSASRCAAGTPTTRAGRDGLGGGDGRRCATSDRVFSTYRDDSVDLPPRPRRDRPRRLPAGGGRGARRSATRAERESGGAFAVRRPAPTAAPGSTPAASSRAGRSSAPPRTLARASRTPTSASPPAATWSAGPVDPGGGAVADRHRGPARPDPAHRGRPRAQRRRRHLRHRPPRQPPRRRAAPVARPTGVASVTVVGRRLTGPTSTPPRRTPSARTPPAGCATRPGRRGLVVGADGTTTLVTDDLVSGAWDASGSASPAGPTPAGAATSTRAGSRSGASWSTPPSG